MSDFDPFEDEPDETPAPETKTETTKETKNVSETENGQATGITISFKPTTAYDSSLIVVKGADAEDALAQIKDPAFKDLIGMASKVDVFVKDTFAKDAPPREGGGNKGGGGGAPAREAAPGGEVRTCKHSDEIDPRTREPYGPMTFRSGTKNGRVWRAFFCPTPKDTTGQCKPQFLKD